MKTETALTKSKVSRAGKFDWKMEVADMHMNIGAELTRNVPAAAKLHIGRSRSDQMALDRRLWPSLRFFVLLALWIPCLGVSKDVPLNKKRISFYEAELVCPAAPQIGCGSAAKPILLELERHPQVAEAWLKRSGTVIAVVWKENVASRARGKIVASSFEQKKVREIKSSAREQALQTFLSGHGWYRGAAVDRLSEEEAGIMAGRLVRRMQRLITLTEAKASTLQREFGEVMANKLTKGESPEQTEAALMKICQQHLDEKDIAVLHEAHQKGAFSNLRSE
jgi:hypothetical protein